MKARISSILLMMAMIGTIMVTIDTTRNETTGHHVDGIILASSLVPTAPMILGDNASVLAVADSGTGTAADPFIIENRSFQLNYTASGILGLGISCYLVIRNCFFNASDPSGVGLAILLQSNGQTVVDNCTMMGCGFSGLGFLAAPDARVTNSIFINNSGLLLDTIDNFYAENITLEDSMTVIADIGILTHAISHNVTLKNVDCYETGMVLTSGIDFLVSDVDGLQLENYTIDCDVGNCSTYLFNSTNVSFDGFHREAPEEGLIAFNVTNFDMANSDFVMDGNASMIFFNSSNINITSSVFNSTSLLENLEFLGCNDTIIENNSIHGGNSSIGLGLDNRTTIHNNTFTGNATAIEFINSTNAMFSDNTFSFIDDAFFLDNDTNVTITRNIFENMTSGVVFNASCSLAGVNVTGNAYWDYFDINTGFGTYYFYEGQVLPNQYEAFTGMNDSLPFYSEYLFGARVDIVPVADFIANATIILEGDYVQFNFTGTAGNRPCTFIWDFGDMTNGSGENYSHQYSTPGTYYVCLNVTDSDGQSSLMNKSAYILVGASILADFYIQGFPHVFEAGVKYTMVFDGVESLLPSTYSWTFGDGDFSSGTTVAHRYQHAGMYMITLTVTDSVGHTDSISRSIKIKDNGGTEPPGPGPVIVPLSAGWEGLLITGSITVAALVVLYLFSKRQPARGGQQGGKGRKPSGKGRK